MSQSLYPSLCQVGPRLVNDLPALFQSTPAEGEELACCWITLPDGSIQTLAAHTRPKNPALCSGKAVCTKAPRQRCTCRPRGRMTCYLTHVSHVEEPSLTCILLTFMAPFAQIIALSRAWAIVEAPSGLALSGTCTGRATRNAGHAMISTR